MPERCRPANGRDPMRIEDRLQLTTTVSLLVPLSYMGVRWWLGQMPFSFPLAAWFLVDATVQYALILLLRGEQLSRSRFSQLSYATALAVGLPATVLSVFSGLAAEFRLIPLLFHLTLSRHRGRAVYALLLFVAGILLLYPFFSGQMEFLIGELFRPTALALILLLWLPRQRSERRRLRERARKRRQQTATGRSGNDIPGKRSEK